MSHDMKLISAEDLFFQPLDHTRSKHIVDGLIPLGLTILAGAPKSGKSWMMLDIALAVSSGRPFFGKETEQCGVLLPQNRCRLPNIAARDPGTKPQDQIGNRRYFAEDSRRRQW